MAAILVLSLSAAALAIPANFNSDCIVNIKDFAILAGEWLDTGPVLTADLNDDDVVDLDDLVLFADSWLENDGEAPPTVNPISDSITTGTAKYINLTSTDDGLPTPPGALTYKIISLPSAGTVYDAANADPDYDNPDPANPALIEITSVPYTLTDAGHRILFKKGTFNNTVTFTYAVTDGGTAPCGGQRQATITITFTGDGTPPTATASVVAAVRYEPILIGLEATDDGWPQPPGKLSYWITSLPTSGTLQDIKSGAGIINSRMLPYRLSSWTDDILFWSESTGSDSFQFRVNDGLYDSPSTATVTVNLSEHPKDFLAFDGSGYVTFTDHDYYDIKPGFALHLYIRTHQAFCGIATKRGASGAGYVLDLVNGRPRLRLYEADGDMHEVSGYFRVDDGIWHAVTAGLWTYNGTYILQVEAFDYPTQATITLSDFDNAAPFVLGGGFKGDIDKPRFFATWNFSDLSGMILDENRSSSTEVPLPGFGIASVVRFKCNEGTGTTITDDKASHLTGTLNSSEHARWYPWIRPFVDVTVQQRRYGGSR